MKLEVDETEVDETEVDETEPIIQGKVSQKEKHQYSILMHIYGM